MALFTVSIDSVAGGNSTFTGIPGRKMFNTSRVSELFDFGVSDSAFEYSLEWDGDVQTSVCIADDRVATIYEYFSATWNDGAIPLTTYFADDPTKLETVYLDPKTILFGAEMTGYTYLILTLTRELKVLESVDEILALAVRSGSEEDENIWSDGNETFRLIVEDAELLLQKRLTGEDGWDGEEGVDFETIFIQSDND